MRKGWRQWRAEEAREVLRQWRRSGQSASVFSRERGVSVRRLSYWSKRLSSSNQAAVQFVPVAVVEPKKVGPAVIEIEHGGVTVRVPESVDVELVGRVFAAVVRAVRAC